MVVVVVAVVGPIDPHSQFIAIRDGFCLGNHNSQSAEDQGTHGNVGAVHSYPCVRAVNTRTADSH